MALATGSSCYRLSGIFRSRVRNSALPFQSTRLNITTAFGFVALVQISSPIHSSLYTTHVKFLVCFAIAAVSLDTIITLLIVARLIYFKLRLRRFSPQLNDIRRKPTTIVEIWVESAAVSTAGGILFLATYLTGNGTYILFYVLLGQLKVSLSCASRCSMT